MHTGASPVRVLVTGAGGFIGAAVSKACLAAGSEVTAVYRRSLPRGLPSNPLLSTVSTDLRDCRGIPRRFDYLVHCAADVPASCPDGKELFNSNVEGATRLFAEAERAGARAVVYMSSMAVYGNITVPLVNERTPTNATDAYGRSKLECERLLQEWVEKTHGVGVAIRLPGVVGAGGRNNFLCDTLQRILKDQVVKARNPDAAFNNLLHVDDLASFVIEVTGRAPRGTNVLTLAAREPLSIREVLSRIYLRAGKDPRIDWEPAGGAPFLIEFERALALAYRPVTVRETIDRFVANVMHERSLTS